MAIPVGPLFAAGNQIITKSGHRINYWADAHNIELQRANQPMQFHWLPDKVVLYRKPNGLLAFAYVHFSGVRSGSTTIGETGDGSEVAGAMLTFSTISAPPDNVLAEAHEALLELVRANGNPFWHWNGVKRPNFSFVPIVSNTCVLSNTLPGIDGGVPAPEPPTRGRSMDSSRPRDLLVQPASGLPMRGDMPRTVPLRGVSRSNIDPMFIRMDGAGPGPINPHAAKPYGALLGSIPAAVAYAGFHDTGTGPLFVTQNMNIRVVSPLMTIDIVGEWKSVQEHYSGHATAGGYFWDVDIKAQFDSMRKSGVIRVNTFVDESLPGAKELKEYMDKRSNLVFEKFNEMAKQTIFDPVPFNEAAAQAEKGSGGFLSGWFGGGGAAFKLRQQRISLPLEYHETREMAYLQPYQVGGTLDGVADDIKADPAKDKIYFTKVDLGDWDRKIVRIAKPVINWPSKDEKWVGEPVSFASVQVGYPNAQGAIQWDGHVFNQGEGPTAQWNTAVAMKKQDEVKNPPPDWKPDRLYLKRMIHFTEPPSAVEYPYARVQVEVNKVDLDPGEFGSVDDRIAVEVRADSAGTLALGPIGLGVNLTDDTQVVEVTMQAMGTRLDGKEREPVRFTFKNGDQFEPRYWKVYTGQPDFEPKFRYKVRVIVKGTLFTPGQEWEHRDWVVSGGGGDFTVSVPMPDSSLVNKRSVPLSAYRKAIGEEVGVVVPPPQPSRPPGTPARPNGNGHAPSMPARPPSLPSGVGTKPPPSRPPVAPRPGAEGSPGPGAYPPEGNGAMRLDGGEVTFMSLSPEER